MLRLLKGNHGAVAVTEIEAEHSVQIELLRSLQSALMSADRAGVVEIIERLEDVTSAHFQGEQLLMRLHAYPGFESHQKEHDHLIAEFRDLRAHLTEQEVVEPQTEVAQLEGWLLNHIRTADQALTKFLIQVETSSKAEV